MNRPFLADEGYTIPHSLMRLPCLEEPDSVPKFLTEEQVKLLRDDFEGRVKAAGDAKGKRDALLDRADFYLLWPSWRPGCADPALGGAQGAGGILAPGAAGRRRPMTL